MAKRRRSGFGGPPAGAPNQSALMRQIQKMQEDMEAAQAELEEEQIEVSVGGGAIKVLSTVIRRSSRSPLIEM
jgi:hypothetical protein